MLESSDGCNTLRGDGTAPLKSIEIEDKEIIEPKLTITTTKDKHLIINDTASMELPHRCLASDDAWNIEAEFINTFLQVNEYDIGKNLESVPSSIDNDLRSIPNLTRVTHSWLRKFVLVHFWL